MSSETLFPHAVFPYRLEVCQAPLGEADVGVNIWETLPNLKSLRIASSTSEVTLVENTHETKEDGSKKEGWVAHAHSKALEARAKWMEKHGLPKSAPTLYGPSQLKPDAAPFVPANLRHPNISDSSSFDHEISASSGIPWYPAFLFGVSSSSPEAQRIAAATLVDSQPWNIECIVILARELCCCAAEPLTDAPGAVAKFTRAVYVRLRAASNEWMARALLRHLQDSACEFFNYLCGNHHSHNAGLLLPQHVSAAMCLGSFVGDLNTEGMFTHSEVKACVDVLLAEPLAVEKLQVVYRLLTSSSPTLWLGETACIAKQALLQTLRIQAAHMVPINAPAFDVPAWDANRIHELVEAITSVCNTRNVYHAALFP
ncbi:hypothetical protein GLOTRDRAFT_139297 [Gloeophyllum trabeum ATCC 11539]|uniref:Uncharacterized protein n=1 Tax=Gloeophyllum trabeum (strain ATCC 11539 / FP-39264 / Madison 617) TaxID=670483 RepID=S7Q5Q8_GLOTA|nr:uncharacterized protein GLOTRDRAFT_139297 [Gloeophyllum trabeum ATCC 11539]EPQ54808.1 hypothetical protein GLOTRDRAFT_139297 [Gloeophyllum trabeum ATCC 11539]